MEPISLSSEIHHVIIRLARTNGKRDTPMKLFLIATVTAAFAIATLLAIGSSTAIAHRQAAAEKQAITTQIVTDANDFLATLDQAQRQRVTYAFNDTAQRARWSNFPVAMSPRGGLSLKEMTAVQQAAAMKLLAVVLSHQGFEKVQQIRQADDDFKNNGSRRGPPGGPPGGGPGGRPGNDSSRMPNAHPDDHIGGLPSAHAGGALFGSDLYFISFLGAPSITNPWMLQFGGHHLALNITIAGSNGVLTPSLTGAQPATFQLNGQTIRPLGQESDKGLAMLQSLNADQRKQAILTYRVADLILGPGQDGKKIAPEGLRASAMNESQRALLLDLISQWVGIANDASAKQRMLQMKADLDETWFAWSGPTTVEPGANITAYYRIQGPHLVIEYAPQRDEPSNHVHTIYRDPTNDYGTELIAKYPGVTRE
jgi:Protein of unknown function (DUF3500)